MDKPIGVGFRNQSAETYYSENSFPVSFGNNIQRFDSKRVTENSYKNIINTSRKQQRKQMQQLGIENRYLIEKIYEQGFPNSSRRKKQGNSKQGDYNKSSTRYKQHSNRLNVQQNSLERQKQLKTKQDIIRSIYIPKNKTKTKFRVSNRSSFSNKSLFRISDMKQQQIEHHQTNVQQIVPKTKIIKNNNLYVKTKASKTARQKFQLPSSCVKKKSHSKLDLSNIFNSMPRFQKTQTYQKNIDFPQLFENQTKLKKVDSQSDLDQQVTIDNKHKYHTFDQQQNFQRIINNFKPHTTTYSEIDKSSFKIKKYKNGVYFGELSQQQKKNGIGIIFYFNGKLFQGQFKNDMKQGKGYQLYVNSSFYQGQFVNGYKQGKGRFVWNNGQVYDGQWHLGKKHGSGMWKASEDSKKSYIGEWFNGKPHGFGVYINNVGDRYQGQFNNGLKQGHGTQRFFNGNIYVGNFVKGLRNGGGQFRYKNGDVYVGQFCNNLRHGKGKYTQYQTKQIYQGNYQNDNISGQGQVIFSDGVVYQGCFQNNFIHGQGTITYPDDTNKSGIWINGIRISKKQSSPQKQIVQISAIKHLTSIREQRKKKLEMNNILESKKLFTQTEHGQIKRNIKKSNRNLYRSLDQNNIQSYVRKCSCLVHRKMS